MQFLVIFLIFSDVLVSSTLTLPVNIYTWKKKKPCSPGATKIFLIFSDVLVSSTLTLPVNIYTWKKKKPCSPGARKFSLKTVDFYLQKLVDCSTKFTGRACALHCHSPPFVVDQVVVVVLKLPIVNNARCHFDVAS